MRRERTSYAFLMEMLWVCGFFALSACLFVLAFAKAEYLSRRAEELNHAVLLAQNGIELEYAEGNHSSETITYYDSHWEPAEAEGAPYTMTVKSSLENQLLTVTATVTASDGTVLYSLDGCKDLISIPAQNTGESAERRQP